MWLLAISHGFHRESRHSRAGRQLATPLDRDMGRPPPVRRSGESTMVAEHGRGVDAQLTGPCAHKPPVVHQPDSVWRILCAWRCQIANRLCSDDTCGVFCAHSAPNPPVAREEGPIGGLSPVRRSLRAFDGLLLSRPSAYNSCPERHPETPSI